MPQSRPLTIALALLVPVLIALGCARHNRVAPYAGPMRVAPRLHWAHPNAGARTAQVDSLVAEAFDGAGQQIAGPAPLSIDPEAGTFSGSLDVPSGLNRRIVVSGFTRGDLIYRGLASLPAVAGGDTARTEVTLLPSLAVALRSLRAEATSCESLDVALVDTAAAPFSQLAVHLRHDGESAGLIFGRILRGPDLPPDAEVSLPGQGLDLNLPGLAILIRQGGQPLPAGARSLLVLRYAVCPSRDCTDGAVHTLAVDTAAALGLNQTALPLMASGTQVTVHRSAIPCGGGTSPGPFRVIAYIVNQPGQDSGFVFCSVDSIPGQDSSAASADTSAAVTLTPQDGSPVRLQGLGGGEYAATGSRTSTSFPYVPIQPGRRYTLAVDLHGTGHVDASGTVRVPAPVLITNPTPQSTQPSTFDMTWSGVTSGDSTFYWARVASTDSDTTLRAIYGLDISSAHMSGLPIGAYVADVTAWNGQFFGLATGGAPTPNLTGPRTSGFFWAYKLAPNVNFSVGVTGKPRQSRTVGGPSGNVRAMRMPTLDGLRAHRLLWGGHALSRP